jgi:hypothetical protein
MYVILVANATALAINLFLQWFAVLAGSALLVLLAIATREQAS